MMLTVANLNVNILCFTEHWLLENQMNVLNIDQFILVSTFSRSYSTSGGSCIFTINTIQAKEGNYLFGLGSKNVFEMSVVELPDSGTILAYIYRSPDSAFYEFLCKLELLIIKVHSKGKSLILCGDLNVNFVQYSGKLQELQNLLLMYNLTNINSPTRITSHTRSLTDVITANNTNDEMFTEVIDFG
jgi:hypothetical protein